MRGCKGGEGRNGTRNGSRNSITLVTVVTHDFHHSRSKGSKGTVPPLPSIHPSTVPVLPPTCPPKIPKIPIEGEHQLETPSASQPTTTSAFDPSKRLSPFLSFTNLLSTRIPHPFAATAMVGLSYSLFRTAVLLGLGFLASVGAQTTSNSSSPTPPPSVSLSISTATLVSNVLSGSRTLQITSVFPVTNTYPLSSSSTGTPTSTTSPTVTSSPAPIRLDTKLDPGFGVLGALLILTGIPSAFLGHKNRWY